MVLGLSVTPTTVGFVLVEGQDADGVTLDSDTFDVRGGDVTAVTVSEHVATAMLRAEAVAAAGDHQLLSIGVTWNEDADWEGSVLLESLDESGIDNVVAVGLPDATEALARGIGHVVDYEKTAACLLEPGGVMALQVDSRGGVSRTPVERELSSDAAVADWLASTLDRADWQPDGLVVVGSAHDIDAITTRLRRELPIPVVAPAEVELALARGAALASVHDVQWTHLDASATPVDAKRRRRVPLPYLGALTMLVAGALTFVVSVSWAVGLKLTSDTDAKPVNHQQVVDTPPMVRAGAPPMVRAGAPAPPPIVDLPPPAADPPPPPDATPVDAPPPDTAPVTDAPDASPVQAVPDDPAADTPPTAGIPPAAVPPPPPPAPPTTTTAPVPAVESDSGQDHSPLLTKILEHIPGLYKPPAEQTPDTTDPVPPPTDAPPPVPGR